MPDNPFADADLDAIEQRLEDLATDLEAQFGNAVRVQRSESAIGKTWTLTPANDRALGAVWIAFHAGDLQLESGRGPGGRWELSRTSDHASFIEQAVHSIAAGRVTETTARGRSRVTITLPDGTPSRETGSVTPAGCLPLPLWPRWADTRQYEPYR
ncbi:hypothetical protein [Phycicoccus flavus]|uniref:hypothetical protein n=1 Tax=Phycicoccus flavus TaxID=2502783 RepID=UPI000FEBC879|nr:hypothetical protein [Phycicoccus flavus]NHA67467.1 hypothetical protein [Phycicoccus flavus]